MSRYKEKGGERDHRSEKKFFGNEEVRIVGGSEEGEEGGRVEFEESLEENSVHYDTCLLGRVKVLVGGGGGEGEGRARVEEERGESSEGILQSCSRERRRRVVVESGWGEGGGEVGREEVGEEGDNVEGVFMQGEERVHRQIKLGGVEVVVGPLPLDLNGFGEFELLIKQVGREEREEVESFVVERL